MSTHVYIALFTLSTVNSPLLFVFSPTLIFSPLLYLFRPESENQEDFENASSFNKHALHKMFSTNL